MRYFTSSIVKFVIIMVPLENGLGVLPDVQVCARVSFQYGGNVAEYVPLPRTGWNLV